MVQYSLLREVFLLEVGINFFHMSYDKLMVVQKQAKCYLSNQS